MGRALGPPEAPADRFPQTGDPSGSDAATANPGGRLERLELPACEPAALLEALAARGCNRVLWECGPELAAAALREDCVQQVAAVIAPKLLGGLAARTPLGDLRYTSMEQVAPWHGAGLARLGPDLLWQLERDMGPDNQD